MITFDLGSARFTFRVAAACLHDDHVLAYKPDAEDFWFLPGGRVETMETAEEALRRELREELDAEPRIERLLWLVENFFTLDGRRFHELGLYYHVSFPSEAALYRTDATLRCRDAPELLIGWLPLETIEQVHLQPRFLRTHLRYLPSGIEHVVNRDPDVS